MNWYYYKIFLPLVGLWILTGLGVALGYVVLSWKVILISWFLIGPVGSGVGYHRLFSHRQFETWRLVELVLAALGTLAAYAPLLFWVSNHQFHHKNSDQAVDYSSPKQYGFWESFLWARMREKSLKNIDIKNYCSRKILIDPKLRWLSRHFISIIWGTIICLSVISLNLLVNVFLIPVLIEHVRVNLISSLSHMKIPLNYRNHKTSDDSYNNYLLGYLTMGFAWHNNHHYDERKLILQEKWWEIDIEGLIGKILSHKQNRADVE